MGYDLGIVNLNSTSWDNAFSVNAPLKYISPLIGQMNKALGTAGKGSYWRKILSPNAVRFNTTYFNETKYGFYNGIALDSGHVFTYDNLGRPYPSNVEGIYSAKSGGDKTQQTVLPKTAVSEIVAVLKFINLGEYMQDNGVVTASTMYHWVTHALGVDQAEYADAVKTPSTDYPFEFVDEREQYKDWVIPVITWYYRKPNQNFPRTKYDYDENEYGTDRCIKPFVPYTGTIVSQANKILENTTQTFTTPIYYNFQMPYMTTVDIIYNRSTGGWSTPFDGTSYSWQYIGGNHATPHDGGAGIVMENAVPYRRILLQTQSQQDGNTRNSGLSYIPYTPTPMGTSLKWAINIRGKKVLAFPSRKSAKAYYEDWGITIFNNDNDALNLPIEDAPQDPEIETDPPISEIPSYPDDTSDTVEILPPNYTASSFGQCKVYISTNTAPLIKWFGTNTFWEDINRLFANPIDAVFGLRMYSFDIVQHDSAHTEASATTTILNVSTDIPCYHILNGYNTIINGGSYRCTAYYGNFADYINTSYDIFIPYVGIRRLNPSDVVNRTLQLQYAVDLATGNATVFLLSDSKLIMTTSCNISAEIPIQTSNLNDVNFQTLMGVLTGAVSGTKTGFLSGAKTGSATGAVGGAIGGAVVGGVTSGLDNYLNSIEYGYQGSVSGNNAYSMIEPFLIIRRFPIANAGDYKKLFGLANASVVTFNSLTNGYVKADTVEINTRATNRERDEIIALLKSGVHLN